MIPASEWVSSGVVCLPLRFPLRRLGLNGPYLSSVTNVRDMVHLSQRETHFDKVKPKQIIRFSLARTDSDSHLPINNPWQRKWLHISSLPQKPNKPVMISSVTVYHPSFDRVLLPDCPKAVIHVWFQMYTSNQTLLFITGRFTYISPMVKRHKQRHTNTLWQ